jgi:DNA-binding transcriptional ArsR family regulator
MDEFYALADPTRRKILEMLASTGELPATQIYEKFPVSHSAISQHLKVLREANLVSMEKRAQQRIYRLNPNAMLAFEDWAKRLTELWLQRYEALDAILQAEQGRMSRPHPSEEV